MIYKLIVVIGGADVQIGIYTADLDGLSTASKNVRDGLWIVENYNITDSLKVLVSQFNQNASDTEIARLLAHLSFDRITTKNVSSRPFEVTLASLLLGEQRRISEGSENVFFTNELSKINFFPAWSGLKDMSVLANRDPDVGILPFTGRTYPVYFEAPLNGPPDASVIVDNENQALVPDNTSGSVIEFILGEEVVATDVLKYSLWVGTDDTGLKGYEQELTGRNRFYW